MYTKRLLAYFLGLLSVLYFNQLNAQDNICSMWTDCNLTLSSNTTPEPSRSSNFVFDQETEHFVFFQQNDSPNYGNYDPNSYQNMIDQLECGYRYLVCEVGLIPPSLTDKTQIYVGDHPSRAYTYEDFLDQSDYFVTDPFVFDYTYSTMTHEFFHKIQFDSYIYTGYLNVNEGLASLVEQLPSELNFSTSLGKVGRTTAFSQPHSSGSYGLNVFLRYMFEQIQGPPATPLDVNSDWAVGEQLLAFMDTLVSVGPNLNLPDYLAAYLPTAITANSTVLNLDNLYDNFQVARYAYPHVDPLIQPRASFQNKDTYLNHYGNLNFYSTGNILNVGTVLNFDNSNVIYGPVQDYGFQYFLNAEYHIIEPDLANVGRMRFEKTLYDDFIRFQIMIRDDTQGKVYRRKILQGTTTTETLNIPQNVTVSEMVLVIYTVDGNPVTTGNGKTFTMTIEGLTP